MDLNGKILKVINSDNKKINCLVGSTLDLKSLEHHNLIHNKPVGVESSLIVGEVLDSGKVMLYDKENCSQITYKKTHQINGIERDCKGYHYTKVFQDILKKYKKNATKFYVERNCSKSYNFFFKKDGYIIHVCLEDFFNYNLKIKFYQQKDENSVYLRSNLLTLKDEETLNFETIFEELKSQKISSWTKTKLLFMSTKKAFDSHVTELSPEECELKISRTDPTKNWRKQTYKFIINFDTLSVETSELRSKKLVPEIKKELLEKLCRYKNKKSAYVNWNSK